jgi:uncharacterized membrane protein (UPF0127 family)
LKTNHIYALVAILWFVSCHETAPERPVQTGRILEFTDQLSFASSTGDSITTIRIAIADSEDERSAGLMDVRSLGALDGMLFIFDRQEPLSFWMANTPLSLDMYFVNEDFEIVRIHSGTTPFSRQSYASELPARYVVEVNAGFTLTHDLKEGDRIRIHD